MLVVQRASDHRPLLGNGHNVANLFSKLGGSGERSLPVKLEGLGWRSALVKLGGVGEGEAPPRNLRFSFEKIKSKKC